MKKYVGHWDIFKRGILYENYDKLNDDDDARIFNENNFIKEKLNKMLIEVYDINKITNKIIDRFYEHLGTDDPYEFLKNNLWSLYYIDFFLLITNTKGDSIDDFIDYEDNELIMLMIFIMNSDDLKNNKCKMITYLYSQYPELFKTELKFSDELHCSNYDSQIKFNETLKKYIYNQIVNSNITNHKHIKQKKFPEYLEKFIHEFHNNYASRGVCLNNNSLLDSYDENNNNDDNSNDYR